MGDKFPYRHLGSWKPWVLDPRGFGNLGGGQVDPWIPMDFDGFYRILMDCGRFRWILMDFDFFGACRTPKELVERPKELVERHKCTKESPRKGIHKGGQAPKAPAPLCGGGRRPPPLWVLVFVYFVLLGYIFVLLGHLLTLLPYQLSRQIVHSFSSQP